MKYMIDKFTEMQNNTDLWNTSNVFIDTTINLTGTHESDWNI